MFNEIVHYDGNSGVQVNHTQNPLFQFINFYFDLLPPNWLLCWLQCVLSSRMSNYAGLKRQMNAECIVHTPLKAFHVNIEMLSQGCINRQDAVWQLLQNTTPITCSLLQQIFQMKMDSYDMLWIKICTKCSAFKQSIDNDPEFQKLEPEQTGIAIWCPVRNKMFCKVILKSNEWC